MSNNVIFGAGKIARGFIAHLLYLSGESFLFIERDSGLVDLINKNGQYGLYVFGDPEKNVVIRDARAIDYSDADRVSEALAGADVILISIGGKNLRKVVPVITKALELRFTRGNDGCLNIITCENWHSPADILCKGISSGIAGKFVPTFTEKVGISEAVILRTAIEADDDVLKDDPLALNVSAQWELPMDGSRIKGRLPDVKGFKLIVPFNNYLDRKLYTFNAASATVSYLGYLKNYEMLADAIRNEYIEKVLMGVYEETGQALCNKYRMPPEQHRQLQKASFEKYRDRRIRDLIERNARDPIRKLGPDDRLVGPARLVLEYGSSPENIAIAIAAAIYYDNPVDPVALKLKDKRQEEGVDSVLTDVCKVDSNGKLGLLIKEKIHTLKSIGLIRDVG